MADLLSRLTSFINFQKTVTISVPGILLAIAIAVIYQASHLQPVQPSAEHVFNPSGLILPRDCNALSAVRPSTSGANGQLDQAERTDLETRRWRIEDCVRQLRQYALDRQSATAASAQRIESEVKIAGDLMKQYGDYESKNNSLAGTYRKLAERHLQEVERLRIVSKTQEGEATAYNDIATRLAQDQKAIDDRIKTGEQDEPLNGFITRLTDRLVYVLILGAMLGMVMDPVVRQLQVLLYTDGRIIRLNRRLTGAPVPTSSQRVPITNVNYAIGLGLITDADVEAMQGRYGYAAQFGLGIILPLILLLIGTGMYIDARSRVVAAAAPTQQSAPAPATGGK